MLSFFFFCCDTQHRSSGVLADCVCVLSVCLLPAAPLYADRTAIVNGDKDVPLPEGETAAADEPGEGC
jgi:hypothetical protein